MATPWPTMQAFLTKQQQQQHRQASNTTPVPDNDTSDAIRASGAQFRACENNPNLTTSERIAAELAAVDTMLFGCYKPDSGFSIIKDVKKINSLKTKRGYVVPESYVRLSHVMLKGQHEGLPSVVHTVHLWAHPVEDLEMGDLVGVLMRVAGDVARSKGKGVFGTAGLGSEVAFFEIHP